MAQRRLNIKAKILDENSEENYDIGLGKVLDVTSTTLSMTGEKNCKMDFHET